MLIILQNTHFYVILMQMYLLPKTFFRDDSVQPYFVDFVKPCCWVTSQHVCVMYCQKPLVQTNLLYLMKLYGHC